ncbi:hypothetical protein V5O48_000567 [Marasmius crinis-equi]|uniref:Adenine DNA glycosylase n=1 Tax=Marasmius crinis-equi TaxID=585013 RepID=A0ABR3G235_9AGAR
MPPKRKRASENDDDDYLFCTASESEAKPNNKARRQRVKTIRKKTKGNSETERAFDGVTSQHSRTDHVLSAVAPLQDALLKWYYTVRDSRGMPWRKPYNPTLTPKERAQRAYEVWISEIMLQQTQVATVIPYYNAWMEKFPTIEHLAMSCIEDVNALWKGLGYYSRASRLLAGAQKAVKEYGARLPDNAKDMEANIPGIGRYSAGAICSIAYGERVPVLDGNVHRLLSRMLALHASPKSKPTLDILWSAADAMVRGSDLAHASNDDLSKKYPGDINQALIELGSTVCKVRDPSCSTCPLRSWCLAQARKNRAERVEDMEDLCNLCEPVDDPSDVTIYPMKIERKKSREETDVVSVIEWCPPNTNTRPQILLVRRPEKGLLAGLYEFPTTPNVSASLSREKTTEIGLEQMISVIESPVAQADSRRRTGGGDQTNSDYSLADVHFAGEVQHIFSHIRKTYRVQRLRIEGGDRPPSLRPPCSAVQGKIKAKSRKKPERDADSAPPHAVWTPIDKVAEANIGTGVVKVWRLVSSLD